MQGLLRPLVEESTSDQFSLLLLMIRDVLNTSQLRAGSYRVRWQMISPHSDVSCLKVKYHKMIRGGLLGVNSHVFILCIGSQAVMAWVLDELI